MDPRNPTLPGSSNPNDSAAAAPDTSATPASGASTSAGFGRFAAAGGGDGEDGNPELVPQISAPKGGGAIRSIGQQFSADPQTGTGSMSVPVFASPGRGGSGPSVALSYSSAGGNGPWGIGWAADVPSIQRKTDKELPQYMGYGDDQSPCPEDTFLLSGADDLVRSDEATFQVTEGLVTYTVQRYRPRIETSFARIERWQNEADSFDVHWRVRDGANVVSIFGQDSAAQVSDPADARRIFRWLLQEVRDDKGNVAVYHYKQEDAANVGGMAEQNRQNADGQRYLGQIYYGNTVPAPGTGATFDAAQWLFELRFDYGEMWDGVSADPYGTWPLDGTSDTVVLPDTSVTHNADARPWPARQDPFSSHRSGFDIRTHRLCRRVLMFHRNMSALNASAPTLVGSTDFDYDENPVATRLLRATHCGYELQSGTTYTRQPMPPVEFSYSEAQLDSAVVTIDDAELAGVPGGVDGSAVRWVDLHGEGLPGMLLEQSGQLYYKRPLGPDKDDVLRYEPLLPLPNQPSITNLAGGHRLVDQDGSGCKSLVSLGGTFKGSFKHDDADSWENFKPFTSSPTLDFGSANTQLLDLSGNGLADVLVAEDTRFVWYPALENGEGYGAPRYAPKPAHDERVGPTVFFSDTRSLVAIADMTGDGLSDIVRIENGHCTYWPGLGHGRFGRMVTLAYGELLDRIDMFDPSRVRLADTDGSGTTDVIYLGAKKTKVYLNASGNAFEMPYELMGFPTKTQVDTVESADLLGNGTAALVFSTPLPSRQGIRVQYLPLMGAKKPYLLIQTKNNLGASTTLEYEPSTKFYLQDRIAGTPWATKLHFPVQVVTKVETFDDIAKHRFVQEYSYHHGHYDGTEREFRGFGRVETVDTESFDDAGAELHGDSRYQIVGTELRAPAVRTKTWFHLGDLTKQKAISNAFAAEYFRHVDDYDVPDSVLENDATWSAEERRQAVRSLKGRPLRVEVYAEDGDADADNPYTVAERNFTARLEQPKGTHPHPVIFVSEREALEAAYERDLTDPRVSHSFTLDVDDYGVVTRSAQVAYGRGAGDAEQTQTKVMCAETVVFHDDGDMDRLRLGVPLEGKSFEVHGLGNLSVPHDFDALEAAIAGATEIAFEATPTPLPPPQAPQVYEKRVLGHTRSYYWNDTQTARIEHAVSPPVGARGLPHETETLAFTQAHADAVFAETLGTAPVSGPGLLSTDLQNLLTGTEGGYRLDAGNYWAHSGFQNFDAANFYQVQSATDPYGQVYTVSYDALGLLVDGTTDPLGNTVAAAHDYRVLQPYEVTDPNGNRTQVAFDTLGMPIKSAVMGKTSGSLGDTLTDPTTEFTYDLFRYLTGPDKPAFAKTKARVEHGVGNTEFIESFAYFAGSGAVIQQKVPAEPDPVTSLPRWVGNGRTVVDNKGNPVKQYEPFFSATSDFEAEAGFTGVTPILQYDPLGRLVRTDFPDKTFGKVEFDPWEQRNYDPNDTAQDSGWYADRQLQVPTDPDRRASDLSGEHYDTPTTVKFDVLGRAYKTKVTTWIDPTAANRDEDPNLRIDTTSTALDIQGNALSITDARGNTATQAVYGQLGQPLRTESNDAGVRWALTAVDGAPLRAWDQRGQTHRSTYDVLRRPTHSYINDGTTDVLVERIVYGEELATPETNNLRGQAHLVYDSAGEVKLEQVDFKGNVLQSKRTVVTNYLTLQDWKPHINTSTAANIEANAAGQLDGTESFTTSATYDALNRPKTQTNSHDGSVHRFTYNEASLLETVDVDVRGATPAQSVVSNIDYDVRGRRESITYGNDTTTDYEYDPLTLRVTRIKTTRASDSAVLQDLTYTYDAVGNIVQVDDAAQQTVYFNNAAVTPTQKFEYDPTYRLVKSEGREHDDGGTVTAPPDEVQMALVNGNAPWNGQALRSYTQDYFYDEVGNFQKLLHTAGAGTYSRFYEVDAATNRLLSTSAAGDVQGTTPYARVYTHDAHGNMLSMPHLQAMTWDMRDRLRMTDSGGGGKTYMVYDAGGQRVRKVWVNETGTQAKETVYVGGYEVFRARAVSGGVLSATIDDERETLHVSDDTGRILMIESKTITGTSAVSPVVPKYRYQYSNHLGSASLELDGAGAIISYEEYHPFGTSAYRAFAAVQVSAKRYRYTGKERDEETGLFYHGARYLAPWLGRWTSSDPAGLVDGPGTYSYVRNNPVGLSDPSGLMSDDIRPGDPFSGVSAQDLQMQEIIDNRTIAANKADGAEVIEFEDGLTVNPTLTGREQLAKAVAQNPALGRTIAKRQAGQAVIDDRNSLASNKFVNRVARLESAAVSLLVAGPASLLGLLVATDDVQADVRFAAGDDDAQTLRNTAGRGIGAAVGLDAEDQATLGTVFDLGGNFAEGFAPPSKGPKVEAPKRPQRAIEKSGDVDEASDLLAESIGGQSSVKLEGFGNREFDAISDDFVAQAFGPKVAGDVPVFATNAKNFLSKSRRAQIRATLSAAKETERSALFEFTGAEPVRGVVDFIMRNAKRQGVGVVFRVKQ